MQLSGLALLALMLLGAGTDLRFARFEVKAGEPPSRRPKGPCFDDGPPLSPPTRSRAAPSEWAATRSGCLRIRLLELRPGARTETWSFRTPDGGGPPRGVMTQVTELHGDWLVEAVDGNRDGYLEHVAVTEFDDAGQWHRQVALDRLPDGGFLALLERTIANPEQFLIEKSRWRDGGWVLDESFHSAQQHTRSPIDVIKRP